ncbi:MAG: DNA-binding protein [Actinomycetota bacterium]
MAQGSGSEKEVQVVTLRIPKEVYEAMRTYAFATNTSINDVGLRSVQSFLAGEGRSQQVTAFLDRASTQWRVALDKLADT